MPDDFVNNFGLLGQVLFRKRNERREQERLDKELERELVKIASQAGYNRDQAREIAQMQIEAAKERQLMENEARLTAANLGEVGAENRRKAAASDELERFLASLSSQREMAAYGRDTDLAKERARSQGEIDRDIAAWERERGYKDRALTLQEQRNNISAYGALGNFYAAGQDLMPEDFDSTGIPRRAAAGPTQPPAAGGRTNAPARISLKPTKPGETPRNPDSAARPIPVTPAAAPSAAVRTNDVPSLGTPPAPELSTTNAPIAWRDVPKFPSGDRSERAIVDQYIQQLFGRPAVKISPK